MQVPSGSHRPSVCRTAAGAPPAATCAPPADLRAFVALAGLGVRRLGQPTVLLTCHPWGSHPAVGTPSTASAPWSWLSCGAGADSSAGPAGNTEGGGERCGDLGRGFGEQHAKHRRVGQVRLSGDDQTAEPGVAVGQVNRRTGGLVAPGRVDHVRIVDVHRPCPIFAGDPHRCPTPAEPDVGGDRRGPGRLEMVAPGFLAPGVRVRPAQ